MCGRHSGTLSAWSAASEVYKGQPLVAWASQVWEGHIGAALLDGSMLHQAARLAGEANVWKLVIGPAGVVLATCSRIGWAVTSARVWVTDLGLSLDFRAVSPDTVGRLVDAATRRWLHAAVSLSIG